MTTGPSPTALGVIFLITLGSGVTIGQSFASPPEIRAEVVEVPVTHVEVRERLVYQPLPDQCRRVGRVIQATLDADAKISTSANDAEVAISQIHRRLATDLTDGLVPAKEDLNTAQNELSLAILAKTNELQSWETSLKLCDQQLND